MAGIDYLALMVDVTELHVRELGLDSRSECLTVEGALNTGDGVSGAGTTRPAIHARSVLGQGEQSWSGSSPAERNRQAESEGTFAIETTDSKNVAETAGDYSSASQGQCADSSTGGGEHPINSSPLHKFAGEGADSPNNPRASSPLLARTAMISPAIHSGDTIDRLFEAVAVCEERSRR